MQVIIKILKYDHLSVTLVLLMMVIAVITLGSCDKQSVVEAQRVPLYVNYDWSGMSRGAQDASSDIATMKVLLYKVDGTKHAQYDIAENEMLDMLEVGLYKAICVNLNDHVEILNDDRFETAMLVARKILPSTSNDEHLDYLINKSETGGAIEQPGWVFSSGVSEIKVGGSVSKSDNPVLVFPMGELVQQVNFKLTVIGINNEIDEVLGILSNVSSIVNLSTGKIVNGNQVSSPFELEFQEDGTLTGSQFIFGNEVLNNPGLTNDITLSFKTNGRVIPAMKVDITDQMTAGSDDLTKNVNVDLLLKIERLPTGLITEVIVWKPGSSEDLEGI